MYVHCQYELFPNEKLSKSDFNRIIKQSIGNVGLRWLRQYLKLHFGKSAIRRYGYTPRKGEPGSGRRFRGSYTGQKLKEKKHTRPLEYSGEGKRQALYGPRKVKTTKHHGGEFSATITLPSVFNLKNPRSDVKPYDEIRTVLPAELQELTQFFVEDLERGLERAGGGTVTGTLTSV